MNFPPIFCTYCRSWMVLMIAEYVEGRPMPRSSSSFTSDASLKRGGGSVKCCSGLRALQRQLLAFDQQPAACA